MTKAVPTIQKYMTTTPHSIGADQTLEKAEMLMREYGIRHLPVMKGGDLVGVVTDRDIKFIRAYEADVKKVKVEDFAREDAFTVNPGALLNDVVRRMANDKMGSALVVDNGKLVGIFTDTDALKALDELLTTRLTH